MGNYTYSKKELEEIFRLIAMNSPDHILIQDADLRYVWVLNPQLGLTVEGMIGKTDFDLAPKEDAIRLTTVKRKVMQTGIAEFVNIPVTSIAGDIQYFEGSYLPRRNGNGQIDGIIGYFRNVTELKQAERELRKAHDELELRVRQRTEELARANEDLLAMTNAERSQRQLAETLAETTLALSESLNLDTILETLLDYISRLVPFDCANVMMLETETRLAVRVFRGYENWLPKEKLAAINFDITTHPILSDLFESCRSKVVADTQGDPGWEFISGLASVRNWLGVPLVAGGRVIGVCSLDKTIPGFFTLDHVHLAELMVRQATVAVQNAWLFEQVNAGRERLKSLTQRQAEIQEAERRYVAFELHDAAGQSLTSLKFGLAQLEQETDPVARSSRITVLKRTTDTIMEDFHRLAMDLRPASLDHLGLVPAVRQYVQMISERSGLAAQFMDRGFENVRLKQEVETTLYRIAQEALTNAVRHARATLIDVLLERRADRVTLIVEDNGIGFEPGEVTYSSASRLGLAGMQERAEMLGGTMAIESSPGKGTTVVVMIPI